MVFELQSLLDLRRDAESTARRALEAVSADLRKEEDELARLIGHTRAAETRLESEARRLARGPTPPTAEQGLAREAYLAGLRNEVTRRKAAAEEHETVALAAAKASHQEALASYEAAVRDREVLSRLEQGARAAADKAAARRAEDAATDLASVFHRSRHGSTDR
jgi:flagellar biosynthesis chaperone FliJ